MIIDDTHYNDDDYDEYFTEE